MFEDVTLGYVDVSGATVRVRHSGDRQPVLLLLHGHPRTHTTWHRVAPQLAGFCSSPGTICALMI